MTSKVKQNLPVPGAVSTQVRGRAHQGHIINDSTEGSVLYSMYDGEVVRSENFKRVTKRTVAQEPHL